ncbi:MAG: NAD(P)-binding protein [Planctomycetota bacterium]|jgi:NADPH-dependent glutamate synthase beta subunit-like oxidoreductase
MSETAGRHFVAIVGGAVSGSVAAELLSEDGIEVVVVEQNERPYGKIEDGLPRWHAVQRQKEYAKIRERLTKPGIHFAPNTKLGRDLTFEDLAQNFGFSAVLLANGAWRDRPFPVPNADRWVGRGLVYQNPFIGWFNHRNEDDYVGQWVEVPHGAAVFGGGLASIDVVKICQLESYGRAIRDRGLPWDMHRCEKKGIAKYCAEIGIDDPAELGVEPCTLYYRRSIDNMPLAQMPENATPEQRAKVVNARNKLLEIAKNKMLFEVQDCTIPLEFVIESGHVRGLKIQRTEVVDRKPVPVKGSEEVIRTDLVISSIGSLPEWIAGIPMARNHYDWADWDMGKLSGYPGVFGVGNVVTGKGNIRASLLHSQAVTNHLRENYFRAAIGAASAEAVKEHLESRDPLSPEKMEELRAIIKERQERVGYDGDFDKWIEKHTPPDLE